MHWSRMAPGEYQGRTMCSNNHTSPSFWQGIAAGQTGEMMAEAGGFDRVVLSIVLDGRV